MGTCIRSPGAADLCCDSAHKTLGVLTGGAYLHVARGSAWDFGSGAREALAVMGSSSPSYLVLQSLDAVNARLADRYRAELAACAQRVEALRERLRGLGVPVAASDPLRVTVAAHEAGYTGFELAELLRAQSAEPEFADPDWLVLMFTPDNPARDYERVEAAFAGFSPRLPRAPLPMPEAGEACMSPRGRPARCARTCQHRPLRRAHYGLRRRHLPPGRTDSR